jgi:hypothetical protein
VYSMAVAPSSFAANALKLSHMKDALRSIRYARKT